MCGCVTCRLHIHPLRTLLRYTPGFIERTKNTRSLRFRYRTLHKRRIEGKEMRSITRQKSVPASRRFLMPVLETCGASYTVRAPNLLFDPAAMAGESLRWAVMAK